MVAILVSNCAYLLYILLFGVEGLLYMTLVDRVTIVLENLLLLVVYIASVMIDIPP